ncbi:MAG: HEAT repeat domain-containing protein [Phycisphaerales bacterium]|nr:HEAT repeat domain-containing protein [Phycisphaerales bacterium]
MGQDRTSIRLVMTIFLAAPGLLLAQDSVPLAPASTQPVFPPTTSAQADVEQLSRILSDAGARQEDRDEAARRLEDRQTPQTRKILLDTLISAADPGGQLAVARALIGRRPEEDFRDPLFALIGRSRQQSDAATMALAGYKGDAEVIRRLTDLAQASGPEAVRLAAIRALGMFTERRAAAALISLLETAGESDAIHSAAMDALVYLTGLDDFGGSSYRWRQWWQTSQALDEAAWNQQVLEDRAARLDRLQQRYQLLADELDALIGQQYQLADPERRAILAMRLLRSSSPTVRAQGAMRLYADMVQGSRIVPMVQQQVRSMIGDSDPGVRIAVAQALFAMVDTAAVDGLLTQLDQENDPQVKMEFARTLAKIGEPRAIGALEHLLDDPSLRVVEVAADALKDFGRNLRQNNPQLATEIALHLAQLLDSGTQRSASPRFREVVVNAMAAMREPQLGQTFLKLIRPGESVGVRKAALRGIAGLRDRNFAATILAQLDDPDDGIRGEAAAALQYTASPVDAVNLLPRLDPQVEPNESIRNAIWRAMESLLPEMTPDQLKNLADRFAENAARRVSIQEKRRDLLIKANQPEDLAFARQDLGNTYMELNQPEKAVTEFSAALEYWRAHGQVVANQLISQLLAAHLKAAHYTEATVFAAEMIADNPGAQEVLGPMIRDEVERLKQAGQTDAVQALIAAVKKMDPPLASRFTAPMEASPAPTTQDSAGTSGTTAASQK